MNLLVFLADRPRKVVPKDELITAVWHGRFLSDSTLTRVIADLRAALGDDARRPRYIETIPKRGYRLIAAVESVRASEVARRRIVVLPFADLGPRGEAGFTDGITEEITTRLAVASDLAVISRQSSLHVAAAGCSASEIAELLGVDYILEGSVRWGAAGGKRRRVRISPQLIQVPDDVHLWASIHDGTLDEVLEMQIRIAEEVLRQLDVVLRRPERSLLTDRRTSNTAAYQVYLRALARLRKPDFWSSENLRLMVQTFAQAAQLDPEFAAAHAALAAAHAAHFWIGLDRTPERLAKAKRAVDRALELAPDLPMARYALGHYLAAVGRTGEAVATLRQAAESLPNDSELYRVLGQLHRLRGEFDEAVRSSRWALELSPRDARLASSLGFTRCLQREYAEARALYEQALEIEPEQISTYVVKSVNHWLEGDLAGARRTLEAMPAADDPSALAIWWQQETMEGRHGEALRRLEGSPLELSEDYLHLTPKALLAATSLRLLGDREAALEQARAARKLLERRLERTPGDARARAALAQTLALLGMPEEALRQGERAVELAPIDRDAVAGVIQLESLALLHLMLGHVDEAVSRVEALLAMPSLVSIPLLEADPRWRPLLLHPGFAGLRRGRVTAARRPPA